MDGWMDWDSRKGMSAVLGGKCLEKDLVQGLMIKNHVNGRLFERQT